MTIGSAKTISGSISRGSSVSWRPAWMAFFSFWHGQSWLEIEQEQENWNVFRVARSPFGRERKRNCLLSSRPWSDVLATVRERSLIDRLVTAGELLLSASKAFVLAKTIPVEARTKAHDILRMELERATPFRWNDVFASSWIDEPDQPKDDPIKANLAVVKRAILAPLIADLDQAGLRVTQVSVFDEPVGRLPVNLIENYQERRATLAGRLNRVLLATAVAAITLAMISFGAAIWRQHTDLQTLSSQIDSARKQALAAKTASSEANAQYALYTAPRLRKAAVPSVLTIWEAVTRALPESAWVSQIVVDGRDVRIDGFADSAAALIPLLNVEPIFSNVGFLAPVVRDDQQSAERFQISMKLKDAADPGALSNLRPAP